MVSKKESSTHSLGTSFAKMILKEAGGKRVAKAASVELQEELSAIAKEIAINAIETAHKNNRKTVRAADIKEAILQTPLERKLERKDKPLFHHIWFIDGNSGTCVLSRSYSGLRFPDTIFSGLLTGIADLMREVTGRNLRHLILGDLALHMRYVSPVLVVIICDTEESGIVVPVAQKLGKEFLNLYADELNKQLQDLELFEEFESRLEEIIREAGMELPTTVAVGEVGDATLTRESIEESVTGAALREDLLSASELLKGFPLFESKTPSITEKNPWDRLSEVIQHAQEQVTQQLEKIDQLFKEANERTRS